MEKLLIPVIFSLLTVKVIRACSMESVRAVFKSNAVEFESGINDAVISFKFSLECAVPSSFYASLHETTTRLLGVGLLLLRCSEFQ